MAPFLHTAQAIVILSSHKHTLTTTAHIIFARLHPFRWSIQIKCVNEFMVVIKLQQNCNYVRLRSLASVCVAVSFCGLKYETVCFFRSPSGPNRIPNELKTHTEREATTL